eukprot:s481_g15.t2
MDSRIVLHDEDFDAAEAVSDSSSESVVHNCKVQTRHLMDEYQRLGQKLSDGRTTLVQIVEQVELEKSKQTTYVVKDSPNGPNGSTQFLCNVSKQQSWWLPATSRYSTTVHLREDGVPYVHDETKNQSVFCYVLQSTLSKAAQGQASVASSSAAPPAPAPSPPASPVPAPGTALTPAIAAPIVEAPAPRMGNTSQGSVPLPGATPTPDSASTDFIY